LDGYKDVFKMLMMNLKSMSVGCTSIAKVILADPNIKKKQPALAVQIDDTFISLNTFEDSQLAFSRFASISPEDYGNSEDYVFEAVSENINRMLQFHRARGGKETIGNVILYGDTGLFERIRDFLNEMEVHTEIITAPSAVSNHESLDFPAYANAVGALFKRDKVKERVNLLEGDLGTSSGQMGNDATYGILLLSVLGFVALMCSFYGLNLNNQNKELESQISSLQARIDAAKPDLDEVDRLEGVKSKVLEYKERAINALDAYDSTRDWNRQMIEDIDERLRRAERRRRDTYGNEIEAKISTISMSGGTITFPVEATENRDSAKKFPTEFMEQLEDLKLDGQWLESATYAGYSTATVTQTDEWGNTWETVNVRFSVTLKIKSWVLDSIPPYEQPVPEDDAPADAALAEEGEV
jgi:type IV pilus assembly protein PilM